MFQMNKREFDTRHFYHGGNFYSLDGAKCVLKTVSLAHSLHDMNFIASSITFNIATLRRVNRIGKETISIDNLN